MPIVIRVLAAPRLRYQCLAPACWRRPRLKVRIAGLPQTQTHHVCHIRIFLLPCRVGLPLLLLLTEEYQSATNA